MTCVGVSYWAPFDKWRDTFSVGYLVGALLMMSQMFLCLFAVFTGLSDAKNIDDALEDGNGAMATFSFFLFLIYVIIRMLYDQ